MIRVFKILDKFVLEGGRGIVVTGSPFPGMENGHLALKASIEVRSAEEVLRRTKLAGFERGRNCWSPHLPRPMVVLIRGRDFELPSEAELWVDESGVVFPSGKGFALGDATGKDSIESPRAGGDQLLSA